VLFNLHFNILVALKRHIFTTNNKVLKSKPKKLQILNLNS
jgi:hypothetical protein